MWENLEVSTDERFRAMCATYALVVSLTLLTAASFVGLTIVKSNAPEWFGFGRSDTWLAWGYATALTGGNGIIVVVGNMLLKKSVYVATYVTGPPSLASAGGLRRLPPPLRPSLVAAVGIHRVPASRVPAPCHPRRAEHASPSAGHHTPQ